jgi:hypothetical protein
VAKACHLFTLRTSNFAGVIIQQLNILVITKAAMRLLTRLQPVAASRPAVAAMEQARHVPSLAAAADRGHFLPDWQ